MVEKWLNWGGCSTNSLKYWRQSSMPAIARVGTRHQPERGKVFHYIPALVPGALQQTAPLFDHLHGVPHHASRQAELRQTLRIARVLKLRRPAGLPSCTHLVLPAKAVAAAIAGKFVLELTCRS